MIQGTIDPHHHMIPGFFFFFFPKDSLSLGDRARVNLGNSWNIWYCKVKNKGTDILFTPNYS